MGDGADDAMPDDFSSSEVWRNIDARRAWKRWVEAPDIVVPGTLILLRSPIDSKTPSGKSSPAWTIERDRLPGNGQTLVTTDEIFRGVDGSVHWSFFDSSGALWRCGFCDEFARFRRGPDGTIFFEVRTDVAPSAHERREEQLPRMHARLCERGSEWPPWSHM